MGDEIKERVRERYAGVARAVRGGGDGVSCCGPSCRGSDGEAAGGTDMTGGAYSEVEKGELPRLGLLPSEAVRQVPFASAFIRTRKPVE